MTATLHLEKEEAKKGPEMSANVSRKNRKGNKDFTFVTDDVLLAKIERITKLLDKNVSQLR